MLPRCGYELLFFALLRLLAISGLLVDIVGFCACGVFPLLGFGNVVLSWVVSFLRRCTHVKLRGFLLLSLVDCAPRLFSPLKIEAGVNPFLACNVSAPKNVDPEWAALFSRIRLFRQLWRDFRDYRPILLARLASTGSRFKTPTDHLVRAFRSLGWEFQDGLCFQDEAGRTFSLVSASLRHIRTLLLFQWGRYVACKVRTIGKGSLPSPTLISSSVVLLNLFFPVKEVCWASL